MTDAWDLEGQEDAPDDSASAGVGARRMEIDLDRATCVQQAGGGGGSSAVANTIIERELVLHNVVGAVHYKPDAVHFMRGGVPERKPPDFMNWRLVIRHGAGAGAARGGDAFDSSSSSSSSSSLLTASSDSAHATDPQGWIFGTAFAGDKAAAAGTMSRPAHFKGATCRWRTYIRERQKLRKSGYLWKIHPVRKVRCS